MIIEFKAPTKTHKLPHAKYLSFTIEKINSETYPEMVGIAKAPAWAKRLVGKRYIAAEKVIKAIDMVYSEHLVSKNGKTAYKDLTDLGIAPDDDVVDYTPVIPKIDYSQTVVSSVVID